MADPSRPAAPGEVVDVVIGVPTYLRPDGLRDLLPHLIGHRAEVETAGDYRVKIVVIDNDPQASARAVVTELGHEAVRYAHEPRPGISAARNRAVDESATADLLVMIDDDELPRPGWLTALLATWRVDRPALVAGLVVPEYDGELDPWIRAGGFFVRRNHATGTSMAAAAANNVLLDLAQVRACGVRYDPAFGLTGGEDTLFSRSLARRGLRLVWCAESVVTDRVPASRMTRRWVLDRAWSHGNSDTMAELALAGDRPGALRRIRVRQVVRGGLRIGGGAARWVVGAASRSARHRARGLRAMMRGGGMVTGAVGRSFEEYARPS